MSRKSTLSMRMGRTTRSSQTPLGSQQLLGVHSMTEIESMLAIHRLDHQLTPTNCNTVVQQAVKLPLPSCVTTHSVCLCLDTFWYR